jgi:tRNA(adenine34) deaminase
MQTDEHYMALAYADAEKAAGKGEVPTGCVIVDEEGEVVALSHNQSESANDATAHAEMVALRQAFAKNGNWRLVGHTLYVTKEPCPMCAGAIVLSRVKRVVWAVSDPKRGGASVFGIFDHPGINHHPQLDCGVMEKESKEILQKFFKLRRK